MNKLNNLSELARHGLAILHSTVRSSSGLIMILLGAGTMIAGCLTLAVAVEYLLRSRDLPAIANEVASNPLVENSLPTRECPPESLKLDEWTLTVQAASLSPEGMLPGAPTEADLAYRVQGAGERRIFLLGIEAFGGDAAVLGAMTQAIYNDANCNTFVYRLSAAQPVQVSGTRATSLTQAELTVLIQSGADGSGLALYGEPAAEEVNLQESPTPEASQAQFEIEVLAVRTSDVGQIIQVKVSISNYRSQALELRAEEVSLLVEGGSALGPLSAKPALPETIRPGETVEIEIIFPKPAQGLGRLRIFMVEFALADFVE
jgi:hypothetical protein